MGLGFELEVFSAHPSPGGIRLRGTLVWSGGPDQLRRLLVDDLTVTRKTSFLAIILDLIFVVNAEASTLKLILPQVCSLAYLLF